MTRMTCAVRNSAFPLFFRPPQQTVSERESPAGVSVHSRFSGKMVERASRYATFFPHPFPE